MISQADPEAAQVAVSIVNYRTAGMVIAALPALLAELEGLARAVVLIVDNASPGDDTNRLEAHVAAEGLGARVRVRVIRSPRNGGFAACRLHTLPKRSAIRARAASDRIGRSFIRSRALTVSRNRFGTSARRIAVGTGCSTIRS